MKLQSKTRKYANSTIFLIVILLLVVSAAPFGALAQEAVGTTTVNLNVRNAPNGTRIGQAPQGTELIVEGRNTAGDWVLVHARDGSVRGWVSFEYLERSFEVSSLPVSDEVIPVASQNNSQNQNTTDDDDEPVSINSGVPTAVTFSRLNMRSGPSTRNSVVVLLRPRTAIVVEGRNESGTWIVGHTQDGTYTGWVSVAYVNRNFSVDSLPVVGASDSESNDTASSSSSNTRSSPSSIVLAFLNARVDSNTSAIRGLSCASFRSRASALADSFRSMEASLDGVACYVSGSDDDYTYVSCSGKIVTVYNGLTREWAISRYRLVEENGDWKVCGEG